MVTWGLEATKMTAEERERYLQGVRWECEQGHASRVECMDGFIRRRYDLRTMKSGVEIRWRDIPAWISDHFRRAVARLRRMWNIYVLRRKNPYW